MKLNITGTLINRFIKDVLNTKDLPGIPQTAEYPIENGDSFDFDVSFLQTDLEACNLFYISEIKND